jgi:hypothetical protein
LERGFIFSTTAYRKKKNAKDCAGKPNSNSQRHKRRQNASKSLEKAAKPIRCSNSPKTKHQISEPADDLLYNLVYPSSPLSTGITRTSLPPSPMSLRSPQNDLSFDLSRGITEHNTLGYPPSDISGSSDLNTSTQSPWLIENQSFSSITTSWATSPSSLQSSPQDLSSFDDETLDPQLLNRLYINQSTDFTSTSSATMAPFTQGSTLAEPAGSIFGDYEGTLRERITASDMMFEVYFHGGNAVTSTRQLCTPEGRTRKTSSVLSETPFDSEYS